MEPPRCRTILWYLVFTGMIVYILLFVNINVAIIAMVRPGEVKNYLVAECAAAPGQNASNHVTKHDGAFDWSEMDQGLILGAPFWFFCAFQIPAGMMVKKLGPKLMFGWSNLLQALLAFATPYAAYQGFTAIFIVRTMTGMFAAFGFTVLPAIAAKWIPPLERSHFMTCYLASALAIAVGYPLYGWISEAFGWEYIFHTSAVIGCLWFIAWQFLMFNSPSAHPRISDEERDYIESTLPDQKNRKLPTPWAKILTSRVVWITCLINGSYGFIFMMFVTYTATYFKSIYGTDIKSSAALASVPHTIRMVIAFFVGRVADAIITSGKISKTNIRKLASMICTLGAGVFFFALVFSGCNMFIATALFGLIIATSAFPNAGFFAAMVDISPNFASIILAICTTSSGICQIAATFVVGYLTDGNQTLEQWQKVFFITGVVGVVPGIIYAIWGSTELEEWNAPIMEEEETSDLKGANAIKRVKTETSMHGFGSIILS